MQSQRTGLFQEQRQKLSPQMLQSFQLFALPLMELEQRIAEELEQNPALEIVEEKAHLSLDTTNDGGPLDSAGPSWEESAYDNYEYGTWDDGEADEKHQFMQGALTRPESLQDHLLWQLRLQPLPEEFFQIGEILIRNLDGHGFHREQARDLFAPEQVATMETVARVIQGLDPPGCCTKDYKESLLVQAQQYSLIPKGTLEIIQNHLEQLDRGKTKEVSKVLGITEAEVEEALAFIRQLSPYPGHTYSNTDVGYVIPDVLITRREDEFVIMINDEQIPVLGINPFFDEMLKKKTPVEKEANTWVQGKLRDARWFINSIKMRNETLIKVVRALVEFQRDFFISGPRAIVPLTLKDIANEIGVHEATVSRLTNGKYAQTDWGLLELKYFFSGSISGTAGQEFSREGIKHILKEILAEYNGKTPSDQKLCELLEQRGVKIARRTVAKYRSELDITSSYGR